MLRKLLLFILIPSICLAHDIDNGSVGYGEKHFGFLVPPLGEEEFRLDADKPLHCDGAICEGQPVYSCMESKETDKDGRTFKEIRKNFWHWRRVLVAQVQIFAGDANAASELSKAQGVFGPVPFMNYDPFRMGLDPMHPEVPSLFSSIFREQFGEFGIDGIEVRYDYFWLSHHLFLEDAQNFPLDMKRCQDHTPHELMHSPECKDGVQEAFTLVGGDSYKAPFPWRSEGAFVYYDRIPAHPIADACFAYEAGKITFGTALNIAKAHEAAGKAHVKTILKRRKYLGLVLDKLRN